MDWCSSKFVICFTLLLSLYHKLTLVDCRLREISCMVKHFPKNQFMLGIVYPYLRCQMLKGWMDSSFLADQVCGFFKIPLIITNFMVLFIVITTICIKELSWIFILANFIQEAHIVYDSHYALYADTWKLWCEDGSRSSSRLKQKQLSQSCVQDWASVEE